MNDVQTRVLLHGWIFRNAEDNDKISRLLLECKTKLVISCAYPGNYFLFPNLRDHFPIAVVDASQYGFC